SWRMVVSLGKEITAEGIYPGGQSGNPASPLYDNGVDDWVEGNYFPLSLLFSLDPEEADIMYQVKITN
ncbi:MAG: penicillin acylase family protein, partial [Bacteroidota bacterium]